MTNTKTAVETPDEEYIQVDKKKYLALKARAPKGILPRDAWVEWAYEWLCLLQGNPDNDIEVRNMKEWAETLAVSYYDENHGDVSPDGAVEEELSYA